MKNLICVIALIFLTISCKNNDKKDSKQIASKSNSKTIEYDLSDEIATTEGAGAKASYVDGKITKCTINIYGEIGQTEIVYIFKTNEIQVSQEDIKYSTEGGTINTQKSTSEKLSYTIDYNGLLLSSETDQEKITDVFLDVLKTVPFELE